MKNCIFLIIISAIAGTVFAQNPGGELRFISEYYSENQEINDILQFEGIDYMKLRFIGDGLKDKSFHITVKEIWDGKIVKESTVIDSREIGVPRFETVGDSILRINVLSRLTHKNRLKITFKFPGFSVTKEYDAIESGEYSLRNIVDESHMDIGYDEKFYLLAYIPPYEREDGSKSWCEVGTSGKDIESWGEKFGIKHYLIFEMEFQ